jgi:hypothetical protein
MMQMIFNRLTQLNFAARVSGALFAALWFAVMPVRGETQDANKRALWIVQEVALISEATQGSKEALEGQYVTCGSRRGPCSSLKWPAFNVLALRNQAVGKVCERLTSRKPTKPDLVRQVKAACTQQVANSNKIDSVLSYFAKRDMDQLRAAREQDRQGRLALMGLV